MAVIFLALRCHRDVAEILRAVNAEADIVGLAIAEYMPWSAIRLAKSLRTLPLLGSS